MGVETNKRWEGNTQKKLKFCWHLMIVGADTRRGTSKFADSPSDFNYCYLLRSFNSHAHSVENFEEIICCNSKRCNRDIVVRTWISLFQSSAARIHYLYQNYPLLWAVGDFFWHSLLWNFANFPSTFQNLAKKQV